jgi:hypothetical protein
MMKPVGTKSEHHSTFTSSYLPQEVAMQRNSEFPLFFQTAIALFGFLFLITVASSMAMPKNHLSNTVATTLEVAKNP